MDYLDVAISAAKEAGMIHKKYFRKNIATDAKTASFDLITVADTESEDAIVSTIRKNFPDHNFLAEEKTYPKTDSPFTWVIDPLDGTNNFVQGLPIFCASIALVQNSEVLLGVVYDVMHDELFTARKGEGSFLNGEPIRVASVKTFEESLLVTGFYYDRGNEMVQNLERIKQFFLQRIRGLRRFGAAALDLCYVSCGRATGFWEFVLSPWDFAAGKLIVEEAGGRVTGRFGEAVNIYEKSFIIASNAKIHEAMLTILK